MLKDIQFCTCSRVIGEEMTTNQCMIFSFSDRALKMLTPSYVEHIAFQDPGKKKLKTPAKKKNQRKTVSACPNGNGNGNGNGHRIDEPLPGFTIFKIGDNKWRIPLGELDHFLSSLFRFLPGYFEPMERQLLMKDGFHPVCCLVSGKKN